MPEVPEALRQTYAGWSWRPASQLLPAVTAWRLEDGRGRILFLKLAEAAVAQARMWPRLLAECDRLRWARPFLPVPEVVDCGSDDCVDWLISRGLRGRDATSPELEAEPGVLVPLLAQGLRMFHRAPVAGCPFDFRSETALQLVRRRVDAGCVDAAEDLHPEHAHLTLDQALSELERLRPREEDLVVCHGDYCLPNVLIDRGTVSGFVDLGELGVADRWWDLAVGAWSVTWNLGPGWEHTFYHAYGIDPDPDRIAFYRLLYDLAS